MIIKIILLSATLFTLSATELVGTGLHNTGTSSSSNHQDSHGNYAFSYDIVDEHGARNSRTETGDAFGTKKGSYTLHDVDGRARVVNYIADEHGFRVVVNTNEPGTAQSYPAGAIINSPYDGPVAPVAAPVSVVHEVPVSVPTHIASVSHPIKSITAHAAPVAVAHTLSPAYSSKSVISHDVPVAVSQGASIPYGKSVHAAPVAIAHTLPAYSSKSVISHDVPVAVSQGASNLYGKSVHAVPVAVAHTLPSAYSSKSVISHDVPVAVSQGVSIPYGKSLSSPFPVKSVISHSSSPISVAYNSPLIHSAKSVLPHAVPVKTVVHAPTFPITNPARAPYSPKSVISTSVPIAKHYKTTPFTIGRSFYKGGFGNGGFGYSHGLLGHHLGGLAYDTKLYKHRLQGHGIRDLLYGNSYNHGYQRYGHENLEPYFGELTYGNGVHGYNGLKSYYY